jgi:hypothetical protein
VALKQQHSTAGRLAIRVVVVAICVACSQCTGNTPSGPSNPPTTPVPPVTPNPNPTPPPIFAPQTFAGAGDIAICGSGVQEATARLLDATGGTIFTLGDNAYMEGTARQFRECYDPSWGRLKSRTRPTPGNHEYVTPDATPYYDYFGTNAGPPGLGYYSYDLGAWHIISLNSEIATSVNSPQWQWLQNDLAANTLSCTLAYWHKPLFTSGPNGENPHMRPIWRLLYEFDAEVILNGHDHLYERFAPQDPDGRFDRERGMVQIIAGTGGVPLYPFLAAKPNSDVRIGDSHGILKMTLAINAYQWEFVPVPNARGRDFGSGTCH